MVNGFFKNIPWHAVSWKNSIFLIGTFLLTLTAVPAYLWHFGLDPFQVGLFVAFFVATGLSITLGYHRLFAHFSFQAKWPVKAFVLLFGAGAFENSALDWASDHRRHHKHTDHEDDPYNIKKGFFHAHIGWVMFKLKPPTPMDNVPDLHRDRLIVLQHKYYVYAAIFSGFILPALIGLAWGGWVGALGAFLLAGVARTVFVQHMTFFINSLCHTLGRRPYSTRCTARDSGIMALFTFGEGYHNFHHEFQHDYRNGVKKWQFDPTKWSIWLLSKLGLVKNLRRVPMERILAAEIFEEQRQLEERLDQRLEPKSSPSWAMLKTAQQRLQSALDCWEDRKKAYLAAVEQKLNASQEKTRQLKKDLEEAVAHLHAAMQHWRNIYWEFPPALTASS